MQSNNVLQSNNALHQSKVQQSFEISATPPRHRCPLNLAGKLAKSSPLAWGVYLGNFFFKINP